VDTATTLKTPQQQDTQVNKNPLIFADPIDLDHRATTITNTASI
jgi:hypothetical protein